MPTYSIEELFAEKTRALLERTRPRDLYDVVQIVENHRDSIDFELTRELFHKKCAHKGITPPTAAGLSAHVLASAELKADWAGMLAHQLPVLPPLEAILARVEHVLAWLDGPNQARPPAARAPALGANAPGTVLAPPSLTFWGSSPIEQIRFAGANRVMLSFSYNGKQRMVEPYALRRASAGHVLLYGWAVGDQNIKAFRVDGMRGLSVTSQTFAPRYAIEVTGTMIPSLRRGRRGARGGLAP